MNAQNLDINDQFYRIDMSQNFDIIISDIEKAAILKALERCFGNQVAASKMLGLHRNTLRNKIKKLNIDVGRFKI
ncbi:MAG: helix-turn-helix domain-containing protein [Candidatus Omnitrophota bacterium]|jgi:two-component system nitrogen regulation response regulator GlnG